MGLIDADNLMSEFVAKAFRIQNRHGVKLGENWLLDYDDIKDVIDNASTIEERPKGQWIARTYDDNISYHFYCSECKREVQVITDYCPNCGARMEYDGV